MRNIFLKCAAYRVFSILAVQTYFVADEYWQSLEIAHSMVFGYGYRTWEFNEKIRSAAHPFIFSFLYKVLKVFGIDNLYLIIYMPRLFQALLTAAADTLYYRWCRSLNIPPRLIWMAIIFDWFSFYCGSRTIINTFEQNLVVFGISNFPWRFIHEPKASPSHIFWFASIVTACCYIRPTACIIWAPFCFLWFVKSNWKSKQLIIQTFAAVGILVCTLLGLVDTFFYGFPSLTPWNFINFNVVKGLSSFYGSHPFHWYFTQGIPVVLGVFTLPFVIQLIQTIRQSFYGNVRQAPPNYFINVMLLTTIGCCVVFYSFVSHKEFRFILPLSPMIMVVAQQGMSSLRIGKKGTLFRYALVLGLVVPSILFGQLHQRGSLAVMQSLASEAAKNLNQSSLLFLTPCHATPLYSHLHIPVSTRFITCDPPLTSQHIDESEVFFANPLKWVQEYWDDPSNIRPSHIVMFDTLAPILHNYFSLKNFSQSEIFFHTIFPQGRVGRYIAIYRSRQEPP